MNNRTPIKIAAQEAEQLFAFAKLVTTERSPIHPEATCLETINPRGSEILAMRRLVTAIRDKNRRRELPRK